MPFMECSRLVIGESSHGSNPQSCSAHPWMPDIRGTLSMGFVLYSIFLLIYLPKEIISGLQRCLDSLQNYCGDWRLAVNLTKTKVIIFSKKAIEKDLHYFYYGPNSVEIVDSYKYLGIIFHFSGKFKASVSNLADKARKAFFALKAKLPCNKTYRQNHG